MNLKTQVLTGVKWNTANRIISISIGIIQLAILTRLLDKADFGLIAIAMMVIEFTNIFSDLGFTTAIIHKQHISDSQYSSMFWMNLSMGILIFLALCLLSPFISSFYTEDRLRIIIPLLSMQVVMNGFGKMFQTIKTKELDFELISKTGIYATVSSFIVTVILALNHFGIYSLVVGQLLKTALNQFVFSVAGFKSHKISFHCNFGEIKDIAKIGGYQLGAQILDFVSSRIDIFLIGKFFSLEDLGLYNIAKNLVFTIYQQTMSPIKDVVMSAFAKIQNDAENLKSSFARIMNIMSAINGPIYTILLVFASPIVSILYASEYSEVSVFLQILSPWGFMASVVCLAGMVDVAKGRTDLGYRWTWVRVLMNTFCIFTACQINVSAIAAMQTILGLISIPLYYNIVIAKILPVSFKDYLSYSSKNGLYALICGAPFAFIVSMAEPSLYVSIIMMILYPFLYCASQWSFFKDAWDTFRQ